MTSSVVFIANFEHISYFFLVFLLLILNKQMFAGLYTPNFRNGKPYTRTNNIGKNKLLCMIKITCKILCHKNEWKKRTSTMTKQKSKESEAEIDRKWKLHPSVRIRSLSVLYFSIIGLNMEIFRINLLI